jgi:MFS family permease
MNTQLSHTAQRDPGVPMRPLVDLKPIVVLSVCMALQMTSYVMIVPLFARRFSQFGASVQALAISEMGYALAATIAAPFMGALADRLGRRRLVLGSLAAYVLAFSGYLFAPTAFALIAIRALTGALTAGLIPAATGMVADLAPADRRAQWIGFLNGGASVGWILGPVLGGALYDKWGYSVALTASTLTAAVTLLLAILMLPETHRRLQPATGVPSSGSPARGPASLRDTLPSRWVPFLILLFITFATMFAWALIEPRFMYYAYDDLRWSSSMLGAVMSTFGIAMMLGEFGLSRLSDRLGRRPVIALGLALFSAQFLGLALLRDYAWIAVSFVVAGFGNALYDPALSAAILDIAPAAHRARSMGLKSTASSIGNILGPALVVLLAPMLPATGIFLAAAGFVGVTVMVLVAIGDGQGVPARSEPLAPLPGASEEAPTT